MDANRRAGEAFLRCAREAEEIRRAGGERRERTQLRAAEWQDNDMARDIYGVKRKLDHRCRGVVGRFLDARLTKVSGAGGLCAKNISNRQNILEGQPDNRNRG